ncbi:MAG TPA: ATP-binding protein [Candidatus Acidoferrales bacterium]|jgi:two-component system sensor histidine kinase CpxA|nr:ATP-binding protein [Candidatus Acidoferrales bacterium]
MFAVRSLFIKVFLWFWVAMILVGATLIFSIVKTQTVFVQAREDETDRTLAPLFATHLADVYERQGLPALSAYLRNPPRPYVSVYFFTENREISGRVVDALVNEMAQRARDSGQTQIAATSEGKVLAQTVTGPSGKSYALVLQSRAHPIADLLQAKPAGQFLRIAAVFLVAGLVCLWLARQVTAPVRKLSEAARQLAGGNLAARVGKSSIKRHDEIADLSRDFDQMAEQIESLIFAQRRLIGDISHELRSPLTRLSVALGIARRHESSECKHALDRIELEVERLNELIGNLLKLSRFESGADLIKSGPVILDLLIREVAQDADFEARNRNRLVRLGRVDSCSVEGSHELLRSAVENVVRNAVNYTPEGTEVELSLECLCDSFGEHAIIRVRDYGKGVQPEALEQIFQPFYRIDDARERSAGGVGLGLAITERAIRLHGGRVKAENSPSGGLIVELYLPLKACQSKKTTEGRATLPPVHCNQKT